LSLWFPLGCPMGFPGGIPGGSSGELLFLLFLLFLRSNEARLHIVPGQSLRTLPSIRGGAPHKTYPPDPRPPPMGSPRIGIKTPVNFPATAAHQSGPHPREVQQGKNPTTGGHGVPRHKGQQTSNRGTPGPGEAARARTQGGPRRPRAPHAHQDQKDELRLLLGIMPPHSFGEFPQKVPRGSRGGLLGGPGHSPVHMLAKSQARHRNPARTQALWNTKGPSLLSGRPRW
jgi:hypothetical protein